ncbi:MAG TPA: hypothetical protein VIK87_03665 [Sphingomonadales bacterium]
MVKLRFAYELVARGWGFVLHERRAALRLAAWPAALWLAFSLLSRAAPSPISVFGLVADCLPVLFAVTWFRFVLGFRRRAVPVPTPHGLLRAAGRVAVVVPLAVLILLPPTLVLAGANLALTDAPFRGQAVERAVDLALPLALLITSPLLVRIVAYYAALAAGRDDIRARDIWRWSRGNGLTLVLVILLSLAPALVALGAVRLAGDLPALIVPLLVLAAPMVFLSVAVTAASLARAMGGLLVLPVTEAA